MRDESGTFRLIPYGHQDIDASDIEAVVAVLRSDWLTQGPTVGEFERQIAAYCGSRYAVAVNSGTSALHLACLAAGVGAGDAVWTTPNTFVASANCALYCGATVDFVDIDPRSYNLCPNRLEEKLARAARAGTLPKAVIPVHFSGQPCDLDALRALSAKYGFCLIEDACHAFGADYRGRPVGSGCGAGLAVFSFHPVKIITTGEGGVAVTDDEQIYRRLLLLRTHGITRDAFEVADPEAGPWYYEQQALGFNYRLTDLQAALGISQLKRATAMVARRRELAARYDRELAPLPLTVPVQDAGSRSSWHLYAIRLRLDALRKSRLEIFNALRAAGIGVNVHYIPVHLQPYFRKRGFKPGDFPLAEQYYREAITLPLYSGLTDAQQASVIETLGKVLAD